MDKYATIDKLPRYIRNILGDDYEALGFVCNVINEELNKGTDWTQSIDIAWKWLKETQGKP